MYFQGLTFIFSEDPPENHLMVIGGLLLKYYILFISSSKTELFICAVYKIQSYETPIRSVLRCVLNLENVPWKRSSFEMAGG